MQRAIQFGDEVMYSDTYYVSRYINEEGEMDVWDETESAFGKVMEIKENKVLVLFYTEIDTTRKDVEKLIPSQAHSQWMNSDRLGVVSRTYSHIKVGQLVKYTHYPDELEDNDEITYAFGTVLTINGEKAMVWFNTKIDTREKK